MTSRLAVFPLAVCLTATVCGAAPLFQDDFSNGLGKWTPYSPDDSYMITTTSLGGNPAAYVHDYWSNGAYLISKQSFNYVGTDLSIAVDMKHAGAGGDQNYSNFSLANSACWGRDIARVIIEGSSGTSQAHTFAVNIVYDSANHLVESSGYRSIDNGDVWNRGRLSIRPTGIVDFYLGTGTNPVWSSTHPIDPSFGTSELWLGGRASYYDNVLVTPEPAGILLLALGGLAALRRRRA
jgi:hypothetical protein